MKKMLLPFSLVLLALCAGPAAPRAQAGPDPGAEAPYAYHLRLVRVSTEAGEPGTALGWADDEWNPVVLPEHEFWGSREQLDAVAAALGGARASAVTGFFVAAGADGVPGFERKIYVGDSVLDLAFRAVPPAAPGEQHRMLLNLDSSDPGAQPLVEAELLLRTDRTVAVACPALVEGDWIVAAVTLIERAALVEQSSRVGTIYQAKDSQVEAPRLLNKIQPAYPEPARRAKLSGDVILQVVLDRDGIPRAPTVVEMTPGCEELAAAAVDAVMRWRYEPAKRNGEPVTIFFNVTVSFKLS